jgi:translation elongation factor EF-1beta
MSRWKTTIRLGDLHSKYDAGELKIGDVARGLAERVRKNCFFEKGGELDEIAEELDMVEDVEDYDFWLGVLYEFGDHDHRVWIDTIKT